MKSKELKEKSVEELAELAKSLRGDVFQARLRNYTNQLDDTASIPRSRRDIARVQTEIRVRELDALHKAAEAALAGETK
jgi:large subunit ribosomal protein L29